MRSFTICYNRSAAEPNRQKQTPSLLQGNNTVSLFYSKFILLAFIMVIVCGNAKGQTRMQTATGNTGSSAANTFTVTLNSAPANGNTLMAIVSTRGNTDSRMISISQTGATWTRAVQKTNTNGVTTEIWYAPNTTSAVTTVRINLAASLCAAAVVMEYSGILTTNPLDKTASATGNNNSPLTGTTTTTTQANELWIGGVGFMNSNYNIQGNPANYFTNITSANSNSGSGSWWWWTPTPDNDAKVYAFEKIVTSTGQASTGGTLSNSTNWSGAIATFIKQPPPQPPTITSFTPKSSCAGSTVTITINGTNLSGATAANVKIGVTAAISITSNTGTQIVATIKPTATGKVTVTTPGGTATSDDSFTVSNSVPTAAGAITGTENVCQGSNNITYTVPAISGATSYVWTYMGAGATLNGSVNTVVTTTNSVSINFSATATTGFLNVKGQSPCGVGTVSPNYAIQVNSLPPNPIREIITNENCPGDKDGAIKLKIPTALIFDGPIPGVTKEVSNLDGNPAYNDGVNLNGSLLNNLTGFTVEGWVNTDVTVGNVALFGQNNVIEVGFFNNKVELYSIGIKAGNCVSDIEYPIDGKWHHIAGTGDKYRMKIYIDGIQYRDWVYDAADQVTNYGSSTYLTRIGRQVFDDTDLQPFTGQIVKVGFWNYAMTQPQIAALAGGGFHDYTSSDAGLIAGYNFYETTGDVTLEPVSSTSSTIPMGTLVRTPRWNEVYDYVWTKTDGGTYSGAATKNIKLIERGDYNVTVASKYGCGTNSATFTVTGKNNYWTGAVSTDWGNKDNWTCGVVREGKDVVFATSVNNPSKPAEKDLELLDANHTIGDLRNETSLVTVIPPARILTVQGKVYGSDTDPKKILIKADSLKVNGSLIFTNPELNPAVKATVQMYARGLKDKPWSWYDPISRQTFSGSYRWQFFGVPVSDSGTLASNSSLWGSYIRKYNENKNLNAYYQKWEDLGNNDVLSPFTGYEITQDKPKMVTFSGKLVTNDVTLSLTKTTDVNSTKNYGSGYNIFGNSFTAPIDIKQLVFGDDVDATVHIYNTGSLKEWGNAPRGGTQAVVGAYMAISKDLAGIGIPRDIPSMQGFLVKVKDTGGANATVTIPYNAIRNISAIPDLSLQHVKRSENEGDITYMTVDVTCASGVDRVWLYSVPGKSHGYDNGYDGERIMLATGVALYADELSGKYQLNAAEDLDETYLAFRAGNESDYTLKVDKSKLNGYETLYLWDLKTGAEINLSAVDTATYHFSASNNQEAEKRFVLTRRSKTGIEPNIQHLITIYSAGKTIWLNNISDSQGIVEAFELTGKQIYSGTIQARQKKQVELNLPEGVYVIKAKTEEVNVVRKVLIGKNQ